MDRATAELKIAGLSDAESLNRIGMLIDAAWDGKSPHFTDQAFALLDEVEGRALSPDLAALAQYFRANAWANRELMRATSNVWSWEQPECQEQILSLRRAVRNDGFQQLPKLRQCQILTNLANQLDKIGRFIEAVEIYDRALSLNPRFGMAHGNRGVAFSHYARSLYDGGHAGYMLVTAHEALTSALATDALYESPHYQEAQRAFMEETKTIEKRVDVNALREEIAAAKQYGLGESAEERRYRTWCLKNRLFINPLNDLGALHIAACDILTLPTLVTPVGHGLMPAVIGFFNQMKQEFVSARYLYYEGVHAAKPHFSDRDVLLYNTLDYPVYSLAAEKIRLASRAAYSIFDKISFFLNDHLTLGHQLNQVSFRSVWYEPKGKPPRPLLARFATYPNWPLRGLFWVSKDFFEEEFRQVTEPDAESLNEIRNHLEHKYLQLHQEMVGITADPQALRYSIYRHDFEARTLRLLKLARAAVIHLSLSVWSEERGRKKNNGPKRAVSMPLDVWRDEWRQ